MQHVVQRQRDRCKKGQTWISAAEGVEASWWMSLSEIDPASVISSSTKCSSDLLLSSFRNVSFNRVASLKPAAAYCLSETTYACTVMGQGTSALSLGKAPGHCQAKSVTKVLVNILYFHTARDVFATALTAPGLHSEQLLGKRSYIVHAVGCCGQHICCSWKTKRFTALDEDFAHRQNMACMLSIPSQHTYCKSSRVAGATQCQDAA